MIALLKDPNPAGLFIILTIMAFCAGLCTAVGDVRAQEGASEQEGVEDAIWWLLRETPGRLRRERVAQKAIAAALVAAGDEYNVSPYLLLSIAYRESSLRVSATGKLGERGLMQIMSPLRHGCRLDDTPISHARCGAKILRHCLNYCGDPWGAVAYYGSGRTCKPARESTWAKKVRSRMKLYHKLEARFGTH
ncbi:MAG: lytic transglycosylase domain-containing protein [Deltaproteobacteria bacterium]|nr:lytic transglycosylase domain-containing protein [Deltaproteobacteria bacterium]